MKKFENPALPAPIYIYGDIFYSPCLPYYYFHLENIGDLKVRLKIGDDLLEYIVSAYHKNKDLFPNEGDEFIPDIASHEIACADSKGNLYCISAYDDTHLALLAYGNKNQDTLLNIAKLEIKSIDLALAERDDLPIDVLIVLLNNDSVTVNTVLLKDGRYNDDETLLSLVNSGSLPAIKAIAGKRDISLTVFKEFEKFYDNESVLINLVDNKNLPEYMLADIAKLHIWSPQAHISMPFHPQYSQYMDEYQKFSKLDISSDKFKQKAQEFFRIGDFILPLYRVKP
jgi:hypothetical protein